MYVKIDKKKTNTNIIGERENKTKIIEKLNKIKKNVDTTEEKKKNI